MNAFIRPPVQGMQPKYQILSTLCWFTCFEMLYQWKGLDTSTIGQKLRDGGIDTAAARERGLLPKDNLAAAKALGMNALGFGQPLFVHDIQEPLRSSPVWTCGQWNATNKHVVVLIGASNEKVEYYDPWYDVSPAEAAEKKVRFVDFFLHGDRKSIPGLDGVFQFYPLIYWKT
jgi:hypothetical protein